jgi:thymidylate synthase (FAD)
VTDVTVFKTIDECRLELVAHSVLVSEPQYIDLDGLNGDFYLKNHQDADFMPASAARASFGKEDKTGDDPAKDVKLMNFLAEHKHMTPFEYQHATFLIEVPLFIRSQIHRHRTFSYNEISRRYTSEDLEFWVPDTFRGQATNNKQASSDEVIEKLIPRADYDDVYAEKSNDPFAVYKASCQISLNDYNHFIDSGVSREIARSLLPQSLLTRFYMGGNLRNWAHFIELRRDAHAQREVQVVANRVAMYLQDLWPESCRALGL